MPTSDDHAGSRCAWKRLACDASKRNDVVASKTVRPLTALTYSGTRKLISNSLPFQIGTFEIGANVRPHGGRTRQSRCQQRHPDTADDEQPPHSVESVECVISGEAGSQRHRRGDTQGSAQVAN